VRVTWRVVQPSMNEARLISLVEVLQIGSGACVCLIGAGGKTTAMLALAADLRAAGRSVLVTTTTKIRPIEGVPLLRARESVNLLHALAEAAHNSPVVSLCDEILPQGKLQGVPSETVCDVVRAALFDVVLLEADGAARRPLKVHGEHEPVVPACASHLLMVAGLDALGALPGPEVVHRASLYAEVVRAPEDRPIGPEEVAASLRVAARHAPPGCEIAFILNKADDEARLSGATRIATHLLRSGNESVVACVRGRAVWPAWRGVPTDALPIG
jgi:probable selenium-dependent hydroxylase accessory protein YqeC